MFQTNHQKQCLFLYVLANVVSITITAVEAGVERCSTTSRCISPCAACDSGECYFRYQFIFDRAYLHNPICIQSRFCVSHSRSTEREEPSATICDFYGGTCTLKKVSHLKSCVCNRGYYGESCKYRQEGPGEGIRSLTMKYIDYVNPSQDYNLTIVVLAEKFDDFHGLEEITVTTNEGYYKNIKPTGREKNECARTNMACLEFQISDFKVSFKQYSVMSVSPKPGDRYDSDDEQWFSADSSEIGGVRRSVELTIRAVQNKLTYSSVSHDVFVNYGAFENIPLKCAPSILKITNCERNYQSPVGYIRASSIRMENDVIFVEDGRYISKSIEDKNCAKNGKLYWRVDIKDTDHIFNTVIESYSKNVIEIDPFTLPFGAYRAYLEWTVVQQDPVSNFAYCYFDITEEPLVAVISGGRYRLVMRHKGLSLSAAESYDPNYKLSDPEQQLLRARWKCRRVPETSDPLCQDWTEEMPITEPYLIKGSLLTYSAVYNFSLSISSIASHATKPQYDYVRIEISPESSPVSTLLTKCVQNCGRMVIPNQILFIKANSTDASQYSDFKWFYYKTNKQHEERPADSIKEPNLPPQMLIIREDTLEMGTEYTVEVRVYRTGAYAKYSFQTAVLVYEGNCIVEPTDGIRGETFFDIVCTHNQTLLYEFYDKTPDEASEDIMFNGRMLGSSSDGKLLRVRLSRGTVVIYCIDSFGLYVNRTIQVELSSSVDNDLLDHLLKDLTDCHNRNSDISNTLRLISLITDLLPSIVKQRVILHKLGHLISEIPVTNLQVDKLSISTLTNVLVSLNRPTHVGIKTNLMYRFQQLIRDQTDILKANTKTPYTSRWMSPKEFRHVCRYNLNCLYLAFRIRDIGTEKLDSEGFRLQIMIELRACSLLMEKAIDNVKDTLSFLQAPGEPPTTISIAKDSFVVWVMSNDDEDMPLNTTLTNYEVIPVEISDILQKVLNKNIKQEQRLSLQVSSFKENIFWWCKSDISSNLVSTSLLVVTLTEEQLLGIKTVRPPIKMRFNMTGFGSDNTIVNGSAIQLDSTLEAFYLDLHLVIHRFDLPPKSLTALTFLFPQTNGSLHLSASSNSTPDYKSVKQSSVLITRKSPTYTTPYYNNEVPIYLYVAILPSSDVPVNDSVRYTFILNTKICQTWRQGLWSPEGCRTSGEPTGKDAYCQCEHLSFFGVATPMVTASTLINVEDALLLITVIDNPYVVLFIVIILITYSLMCFVLQHRDTLDRNIQEVIVLEDNFPGDPYPYLIAVYTSPRYNAGTTAHVGFRLVGTAASSRSHVFRSGERRVLRRGFDDWFLIFTKDYLEALTFIHLWHDNAGRSPTWYCNRINVFDLTKNEQYQFLVGEWMAVRTKCFPELVSIPLKEKDANEIKRVFNDNFYLGMRDNHMILSIMFCHPRSHLTKVQRLTICMCALMMSLLCSIMYYTPDVTNQGIDDYKYAITSNELLISLENLLMCVIISAIVLFLFSRTRKYQKTSPINTTRTNLHSEKNLASKLLSSLRRIVYGKLNVNSTCSTFWRIVSRFLKSPPLAPVHLHNKKTFETRKHWLIAAWIFCALVIVVCSFLLIYFGFNMGPVKSQQWLSTVLIGIGGYFFLFSSTKILICSVLLAVSFQRVCEVNTFIVSLDDIRLVQTQAEQTDLWAVFDKRCNQMYAPLKLNKRHKLLNKYKEKLKWWLVIDFILSASFVVITSSVVFKLWSAYYFNNYYILCAITKSVLPNMQSNEFLSIQNISDLQVFLGSAFLYGIYGTKWYNNDQLEKNYEDVFIYWLVDGTNRMIGRPKIRQLRVLPEVVDNYVIPHLFRNPELSTSTEDTGAYSEDWHPGSWRHVRSNHSAWKFFDSTLPPMDTLFRLYGASGRLFHDGGFSTTLGPRRIDAENNLSELRTRQWLDTKTRVFFAELTVYNVNYDLFTQVTLIVEFLASGKVLLKAQGTSLRDSLVVVAWDGAILLYIVFYFVRSFLLVNEHGIREFLLGFKNVVRLMIITLSIAALAFLGLHIYASTLYSSRFQAQNLDTYFNFDRFTIYFFKMKIIFSFLFCVTILNVVFHMNFGRRFFKISYVLLVSMKLLVWMILILFFFIFNLKNVTPLLHLPTDIWAQDIILSKQLVRQLEIEDSENHRLFWFVFFNVIAISIVKASFFTLILSNLKLAKFRKLKKSSGFNIAVFILTRLKRKLTTNITHQ